MITWSTLLLLLALLCPGQVPVKPGMAHILKPVVHAHMQPAAQTHPRDTTRQASPRIVVDDPSPFDCIVDDTEPHGKCKLPAGQPYSQHRPRPRRAM